MCTCLLVALFVHEKKTSPFGWWVIKLDAQPPIYNQNQNNPTPLTHLKITMKTTSAQKKNTSVGVPLGGRSCAYTAELIKLRKMQTATAICTAVLLYTALTLAWPGHGPDLGVCPTWIIDGL